MTTPLSRLWTRDTAWGELAFAVAMIWWGAFHLVFHEDLSRATFASALHWATPAQIEAAFLIAGTGQLATVLFGSRIMRARLASPACFLHGVVVYGVLLSHLFPVASVAYFGSATAMNAIAVARNARPRGLAT